MMFVNLLENIARGENNLFKIPFEFCLLLSFPLLMEPFSKKDLK